MFSLEGYICIVYTGDDKLYFWNYLVYILFWKGCVCVILLVFKSVVNCWYTKIIHPGKYIGKFSRDFFFESEYEPCAMKIFFCDCSIFSFCMCANAVEILIRFAKRLISLYTFNCTVPFTLLYLLILIQKICFSNSQRQKGL